jgi:hypothetical protein
VQAACGPGTSQQWAKENAVGGYFRLKSRYSGLCIDVNRASTADGAALIQYTCGSNTNQQWRHN